MATSSKNPLVLKSPFGTERIIYEWPLKTAQRSLKGINRYDEAMELFSTIKFVCQEFPELRTVLGPYFPVKYDQHDYERMKLLVNIYNATIVKIKRSESVVPLNQRPSKELFCHIMEQAYHRSVKNPKKLNKVKGFSADVYGEWSFDYICEILKVLGVTENDVVLDLGSGIGNVVLQLAGMTNARECIGIERGDIPNHYAQKMVVQFESLMKWYGKTPSSRFTLHQNDFFDAPMQDVIQSATIILTNNLVFGAEVNQKLGEERLAFLRDGTRIISTKEFRSLRFRGITKRNRNDFGCIVKMRKFQSGMPSTNDTGVDDRMATSRASVSWTGKNIPFYLHTIDRSDLFNYLLRHWPDTD